MTRIALISDIHGHDLALRAVLDDIAASGVDDIICLGDVATLGPSPVEAVRRLRATGARCVQGNHDAFVTEPERIREYTDDPGILGAVAWCRERLSDDDVDYLRTFEPRLERPLTNGDTLLAFHGVPSSFLGELLPTTPTADVERHLEGTDAQVLAAGHTHIQMLRQHKGRLVVNPGSVGMPFREPFSGGPPSLMAHAEWALVEVTGGAVRVGFRRLDLDRAELRAVVAASDLPLRSWLLEQYA